MQDIAGDQSSNSDETLGGCERVAYICLPCCCCCFLQVQNMDKPAGVAQRVTRPDGTVVVQVRTLFCFISTLLQVWAVLDVAQNLMKLFNAGMFCKHCAGERLGSHECRRCWSAAVHVLWSSPATITWPVIRSGPGCIGS
jgi:hypothetical protein